MLKLTVLVCFAALSIVWTWPVGAFLASRIPHDPGDPILNTYLLWWNATALPFSPGNSEVAQATSEEDRAIPEHEGLEGNQLARG